MAKKKISIANFNVVFFDGKGKLSETEWLRLYGGIYLEAIFERMGNR